MGFHLADLFELVAAAVPEREAVVAGPVRRTYAELERRAARWATLLTAKGVEPGDRVALLLRNGHDHVEALLGAFKARAVPVNVNHHYTADELRHLLRDAGARLVLCEPAAAELVASVVGVAPDRPAVPAPAVTVVDEALERRLAGSTPQPPRADRSGDDRYLLYTGGTTGLPKGVEWRHEDLFFAALGGGGAGREPIDTPEQLADRIGPATRVLVASPLMHGTAQWVTLSTLLAGGTVVLATAPTFDAAAMWDLAQAERVGQLVVVGDAFALPLVEALDAEPERWALDHLVAVASGGASLSASTAAALLHHLPGAVVVDGYGTSETGGQARRVLVPGVDASCSPRFVPDEDTAVLDNDGRPISPGSGALGRIARRGRLPLGYRNDPARSASTFPVIDGTRWAVTGDIARVEADGTITLLGRVERTINSGGEKVDPHEVEDVIRTHPAVADAMVVGVPHPRFGERVGALVRLIPGTELTLERLARHCRGSLAGFKVPRRLMVTDDLPRLASGKPDYRRAVELLSRSGPI